MRLKLNQEVCLLQVQIQSFKILLCAAWAACCGGVGGEEMGGQGRAAGGGSSQDPLQPHLPPCPVPRPRAQLYLWALLGWREDSTPEAPGSGSTPALPLTSRRPSPLCRVKGCWPCPGSGTLDQQEIPGEGARSWPVPCPRSQEP